MYSTSCSPRPVTFLGKSRDSRKSAAAFLGAISVLLLLCCQHTLTNAPFSFFLCFQPSNFLILPCGSRCDVRALPKLQNQIEKSLIGYQSMSLRRWIGAYGLSHAQRQITANNRSFTETRGEPSMKASDLEQHQYHSLFFFTNPTSPTRSRRTSNLRYTL